MLTNEQNQKIIKIIQDVSGLQNTEVLKLEDKLQLLGLNSISFIKAIVKLESEFDIEFGDDDLDYNKFQSISDVANCIDRILNHEKV